MHLFDERDEHTACDEDVLYDLRTHPTDAALAAGYLGRTGPDPDNPQRRRVQEALERAHDALREDVHRLDAAGHPDPRPPATIPRGAAGGDGGGGGGADRGGQRRHGVPAADGGGTHR